MNPSKKRKPGPSNQLVKSYFSKSTQTDFYYPLLSLLDGVNHFEIHFKTPLGFIQKLLSDDDNGPIFILDHNIQITCDHVPNNFHLFKDALLGLYSISITLASIFGYAPIQCSIPLTNPVYQHLKNPENRTNFFTPEEIENVLDALTTFNWFEHRQLITILQNFLQHKIETALYGTIGDLYQVRQDPNKYVQFLTYGTASPITDLVHTIQKARLYFSGVLLKRSNHTCFVSHKTRQSFSNGTSMASLSYTFAVSISNNSNAHNLAINNYLALKPNPTP